jgi:hypothetical protein
MKKNNSLRRARRGVLTIEWLLLATVLIIGTVGAVAAVRNELVEEYNELVDTICQMSIAD